MDYVAQIQEIQDGRQVMLTTDEAIDIERAIRYSPDPDQLTARLIFDDRRKLSASQRKKVYALIGDFARYSGDDPEYIKVWLKFYYQAETGAESFSLSNCSMTTARLFINYLIEFAFKWGIPFKDKGLDLQDDIGKYLWLCIKYRKCSLCGKHGEIHHLETVGQGRDRRHIDHSKHDLICLCREHHTEAHALGVDSFKRKYHVAGIRLSPQDAKLFKIGG